MDKQKIAQAMAADVCHSLVNTDPVWLDQADPAAIALAVADNLIQQDAICAAGSRMLYNFRPPFQATGLDRASTQGYGVIARCNVGEFAMGPTTTSWYGPTTLPGGLRAASGPAMAVAQGIAQVALAVDAGGSALTEAALGGCVAFRPTYGAASRFGIIAYISSTEQLCGVAAGLEQVAPLLEAVCGRDDKDATSLPEVGWDFSTPVDLTGRKVALFCPPQAEAVWGPGLDRAAERLQAAGLSPVRVDLPDLALAPFALQVMAAAEGCNNISRFDGVKYGYRAETYRDMEDLYCKSRSQAMGDTAKYTAILGTYVLSKGRYEPYYYKALQVRGLVKRACSELFQTYDALLLPGSMRPAPLLAEAEDRFAADRALTAAPALAGLPVASLPWNLGDLLPAALQVAADSGRDRIALSVAKILQGGATA